MPRMSVALTLDQVRARTKTVTRRHVDTWSNLQSGDRLTLIEKGMGLPKGAHQVVVCEVEIVSVRVEQLCRLYTEPEYGAVELAAEGFPDADPVTWVAWWAKSHHTDIYDHCRRIEWRYLDEEPAR